MSRCEALALARSEESPPCRFFQHGEIVQKNEARIGDEFASAEVAELRFFL